MQRVKIYRMARILYEERHTLRTFCHDATEYLRVSDWKFLEPERQRPFIERAARIMAELELETATATAAADTQEVVEGVPI